MRYARQTTVSVERSKNEIERNLTRYGASHFGYMMSPGRATVAFQFHKQPFKIDLPVPDKADEKYRRTESGQRRGPGDRSDRLVEQAWEQDCRQRWRALNLFILASLEAVESGIVTLQVAFMPYLVLPNGKTVTQNLLPQLSSVAEGRMPKLLLSANEEG